MDDELQRNGIKQELTTRDILPSKCFLSGSGHDLTPITVSALTDLQKSEMKNELRSSIQKLAKTVKLSDRTIQFATNKFHFL
mmetsp:Transcript_23875/g.32726  ORF Transcript_23875/g.32726 Transcript_23875/m.32726 type:complete len:82 (-) Transcript_23875:1098-1343(-)